MGMFCLGDNNNIIIILAVTGVIVFNMQGVARIRHREDYNYATYSISFCRKEHKCSVNKVVIKISVNLDF